jgi:hypothetical protein
VHFIINLLHKDFSILLSDKKAVFDRPITIKSGKVTVSEGVTIKNLEAQSIFLTACSTVALGIAGNVHNHTYIDPVQKITNIDDVLKSIRSHMECFLQVANRSEIMQQQSWLENQSIATFFDPIGSAYFSNLFLFSKIHNHTRLYRSLDSGGILIHLGSGSKIFEKIMGRSRIEVFASSVSSVDLVDDYLEWFSDVFRKISEVDTDVGKDFTGVISTRESPYFVHIN